MPEMDRHIENQQRRCPRLGGSVITFSYCMISGSNDLPCLKIFDCWWETFDVAAYLKDVMAEPSFQQLLETVQKPINKISSIIDIINMAKQRQNDRT